MSTFGERFNVWLIARGKEPCSPELIPVLNEAAQNTARDLRDHQTELVKTLQELAAAFYTVPQTTAGGAIIEPRPETVTAGKWPIS